MNENEEAKKPEFLRHVRGHFPPGTDEFQGEVVPGTVKTVLAIRIGASKDGKGSVSSVSIPASLSDLAKQGNEDAIKLIASFPMLVEFVVKEALGEQN